MIQKDKPDGNNISSKTIFDTTLLQNLPHIKIAVRYDDLSFRLNLYKMYTITCS